MTSHQGYTMIYRDSGSSPHAGTVEGDTVIKYKVEALCGEGGEDDRPPKPSSVEARWAHWELSAGGFTAPTLPGAPGSKTGKEKGPACRQPGPHGGRQDVRAPDPAGVRGRGPRGLPRAAPLPRQRLALAPGSGRSVAAAPAPPARPRAAGRPEAGGAPG